MIIQQQQTGMVLLLVLILQCVMSLVALTLYQSVLDSLQLANYDLEQTQRYYETRCYGEEQLCQNYPRLKQFVAA